MLPGQGLIQATGPQIIIRIQAAVRGRLLPERQIELLPPTVQPRAALPGRLDEQAQAAVAPGEHAFQIRLPGIMPFQMITARREQPLQQVNALLRRLESQLALPLKGGAGLGDKGAHAQVDLHALPGGPGLVARRPDQLDDGLDIGLCFRGQAGHEVAFDELPAKTEGVFAGGQEIRLDNALI